MSLAGELSVPVLKTPSTSPSTPTSAVVGPAAAEPGLSTSSLELDSPSLPSSTTSSSAMSSTASASAVLVTPTLSLSTSVSSSESEVRTSIPLEQMAAWSTDEPIMVDSEGVILPLPSSSSSSSDGASSNAGEQDDRTAVVAGPVTSSAVSSQPVATSVDVDGATTVFTTVPVSDQPIVSTYTSALPTDSPQTLQRSSSSSILHPDNRLFPLGVAVTCLGGIVAMIMAGFLCFRLFYARQKRLRRMTILSFSPVSGTKHLSTAGTLTPYPFESKAWTDTAAMEQGQLQPIDYSAPTPSPALMAERVPAGRRAPSFYHAQTLARGPGIASTDTARPLVRHEPNASFDTSNCAMYPAGTCPLEHEERMRSLHESQEHQHERGRGSSPVPSFQTDRQPAQGQAQAPVKLTDVVGRRLTPPRIPARAPAPGALVFSPSIDQWTNSVRGFTPRASASHSSDSSIYSLYVPDRV